MTKPLSILITRFPYESVLSGEEWHTITLAEKLRERGHEVAFMGSCNVLLEELAKRDFPVTAQPGGPAPVSGRKLMEFLLLWPYFAFRWGADLKRLTKERGLTTIYMHSLSEKILLTPTALRLNLRVVWVEHQRWGRWMVGNPLRHIYKRWAKHVAIIGVSPLYKESFRALGISEENTHIVTNGIDLSVFRPEVEPLPLGANALHIGTVARLSVDKGVDLLLEAFTRLCEGAKREEWTDQDIHLHMVGEGPLREILEARAASMPCGERVHLYVPYRTMSRADMPRFMKALDIFILASAQPDPFGLVAAESMAVGTATIVTDVCGIRYQLHDKLDSIIIPAGTIDDIEEALALLVKDARLRRALENSARATAEAEFSLEGMVDSYVEILRAA